ncbi:MAG: hypothetical protein JNL18_09605 [Planctomycetaceae bacterium]|nr:hypothetical protein [Planctomycetaceae bacterium]
MPKFRRLTESEVAIAQRWLQGLKSELDRVDPSPPSYTSTTEGYLKSLEWVQHEGIALDPKKVTLFTIFPVLLLIAEHLQTSFGFTLLLSDDLLVLQHDGIEGCVPLELLAFRPTQSPDGRWLDEDDPIDRAIQAVWKIEEALKRRQPEQLNWPDLLLGEKWMWVMTHTFLKGMIEE